MTWKSAFISSALVLGSQAAMANKPLPCPTTGPLQDMIGLVQGDIRQKIENRLRAIETDKKHQVVVVTVKSPQEYGFGSIEQMANKIGNGCKVGFRGENTGVVVLYTQVPSRYRIENANTERYITDVQSGRILDNSKANGVCKKEDVACRLDAITGDIDLLIRKEFSDKPSVQKIEGAIQQHDNHEFNKSLNEALGNIGIGAVVLVVLGGGAWGVVKGSQVINRRNRRKELRRDILELFLRFKTEKEKYPEWFQKQYINHHESSITEFHQYSDEQIDQLVVSERSRREYDRSMQSLRATIDMWQLEYREIAGKVDREAAEFREDSKDVSVIHQRLLSEGYIFPHVEVPDIVIGANPLEYLRQIESSRQTLSQILKGLKEIPQYYATVKGFDVQIKMDLKSVENEYTQLSEKYWRIFGSIPSVSIPAIQQKVTEFSTNFQPVYNKKDITKLKELIPKAGNFLNPIKKANRTMIERISWYEGVPAEIVKREKQLVSLKPNSKHASDANAYAEKTGNRTFRNYNPPNTISKLKEQLVTIRNFHTQKHNLDTIDAEFRKFDDEISKVVEYMGLGTALADIISAERDAELRRKKAQEEEEEHNRRHREEQEASAKRSQDTSIAAIGGSSFSTSSSTTWESGGGSGFGGGGATRD